MRIKEIAARRVEADQAARLLATKERALGFASRFRTHLAMMLVAKYAKVISRARTHMAPLFAPQQA